MNNQKTSTVIILLGPTAAGKTSLSLSLAHHFNTSIISADSRQCFRELSIGVAKPPDKDLEEIKHYFINSHSINDLVNAGTFEQYALNAANEIFLSSDIALMVGGTGLYIKAFCEGMDQLPSINTSFREDIRSRYKINGMAWLQEEVQQKDPLYYATGETENPQRLMRALEVILATGRSIRDFQANNKVTRPFRICKIGINVPKDQLHANIDWRVNSMMQEGLLDEVKRLSPYKHLNALQTVGYNELFSYLEGKISLDEAVELIKKNTRQYAKRQMTWFKKDLSIKWMENDEGILHRIMKMVNE